MGSELDEEDNEVKWFSDVAFRSLSSGSPQVDYLDMYNSSHCSSTGASQPSIQDSPAGANAAWLAYADLRGSAPRLDNEDFPVPRQQQQPSSGAYYPPLDGLDPSKKYEMGSFECVDVAVEREEPKKVRRGVPKRQIQLKRRNKAELKLGENSDGSPIMRQQSTPAALQEAYRPELSSEPATEQTERKGKLQKALSLDETCTKTKMATCLIKGILSKKMPNVGKQTEQEGGGDLSPSENKTPPPSESELSTIKESPKPETQNLSSSINSEDSLSSEDLAVRRETSPNTDKTSSLNVSLSPELETKLEVKHETASPGRTCQRETREEDRRVETSHRETREEDRRVETSHRETREEDRRVETSIEKPEKKTGEEEDRRIGTSHRESREEDRRIGTSHREKREEYRRVETSHRETIEEEKGTENVDANRKGKAKAPLHKVRDVRRLVKNTYNLSFKAMPAPEKEERREESVEERREEQGEERGEDRKKERREDRCEDRKEEKPMPRPQPMQIEYKAVSWRENKNKTGTFNQTDREIVSESSDKPEVVRRDTKPPMLGSSPKLPIKDKEVSCASLVLQNGSNKPKSFSALAPASPALTSPAPSCPTPASPALIPTPTPSHSVSILVKEKGYQADIGSVVSEAVSEEIRRRVPRKHINQIEIPLQTRGPSDGGTSDSHRQRTYSSSSTSSMQAASSALSSSTVQAASSVSSSSTVQAASSKTQEDTAEKETVKKSSYSPKLPGSLPGSPALMRRYRPQVIEVRSLSKEIHKQDKQEKTVTSSTRPQTIEVHSIANGPPVAPKPKFRQTDANSLSSETQQKPEATSSFKQHTEEERAMPNEKPSTSATTIHRHLSNDSTPASNYNKKLSVSAVSSYRPSPTKTTIIASFSHKTASTTVDTETSNERPNQPGASTQGQGQAPSYTQRPTTLTVSAPAPAPAPAPTHRPCLPQLQLQPQLLPTPLLPQLQLQPQLLPTPLLPQLQLQLQPQLLPTPLPNTQASQLDHSQRVDDLRFYASDDPPSYDERESFSPLHLPDLPQRKLNRYHPSSSFSSASSRPPPCSCTSGCPSHGLTPPHHHHSPHTPPFPSHSPGQALPYSMGGQPPLRSHQCRADPQPLSSISYQPSSPKLSTLPSPTQPPPGMYQSLHQPQPSMIHSCTADRPLQHPQHMDPRRAPPLHRSPHGQPPVSGGPYSDHSHSPNLPPMDPQYLCSPQSLGPSYGSEYGSLSGSDYPDSTGGLGYGQTPRRVLMDPDTGKYFYIEVPVQPLRKMLFDPETGQYVEVLIPQSTMSHSGLYPTSAAPYSPASAAPFSSIHNPNMYAPAPQYLPYGPPPPAPHPQPQPPRHQEAPAPGTMHQNGAQVGYRSPGSQGSKPEPQSHAPLDQSYLDSMYYVPTGMNTSPPDCYHKQPSSLPNTGGKRA
ncbi:unnamed protein product [Oncorhynchus mykiss]|uniref:DUF4585 domain-containing protein n=1 Tax=Oncorhynchus mykiss TaxID=8022 RepID=A0A060YYV6_ONCMY|nr:unnamed protein product [Oncorhynchus mykiss]